MKVTVVFEDDREQQKSLALSKTIAEGKTKVFYAMDESSSEEYAIKIFYQNGTSLSRFKREHKIITSLYHPNIIKYYPVFSHDSESDILVMEYAHYGDIFDLVKEKYMTHHTLIRTYFHQLIEGLEYMHSKGIAHLDLKLENLLIDKDFNLKLVDFDQSHMLGETVNCNGTNGYRAPEIITRKCKNIYAADVFSAGVILYAFKAGQLPFVEVEKDGKTEILSYDFFINDNKSFWEIKAKRLDKKNDFFSEDFRKLLRGMLEEDPFKRFTINQIKASDWYKKTVFDSNALKSYMKKHCSKFVQKFEDDSIKEKRSKFKGLSSLISNCCKKISPIQEEPQESGLKLNPDNTLTSPTTQALIPSKKTRSSFCPWKCLYAPSKKPVRLIPNSPGEKSETFASPLVDKRSKDLDSTDSKFSSFYSPKNAKGINALELSINPAYSFNSPKKKNLG